MPNYIAKRAFISPELGNVAQGQILEDLSETRAANWIGVGLIEEVPQTKPAPKIEIDMQPAPTKKRRVNAKRSKSSDS